jgi:hypothetical protein
MINAAASAVGDLELRELGVVNLRVIIKIRAQLLESNLLKSTLGKRNVPIFQQALQL